MTKRQKKYIIFELQLALFYRSVIKIRRNVCDGVSSERHKVYILSNKLALFYRSVIKIRRNVCDGISSERHKVYIFLRSVDGVQTLALISAETLMHSCRLSCVLFEVEHAKILRKSMRVFSLSLTLGKLSMTLVFIWSELMIVVSVDVN